MFYRVTLRADLRQQAAVNDSLLVNGNTNTTRLYVSLASTLIRKMMKNCN
jgi:hypothetical protein